jgi:hypothetical protein
MELRGKVCVWECVCMCVCVVYVCNTRLHGKGRRCRERGVCGGAFVHIRACTCVCICFCVFTCVFESVFLSVYACARVYKPPMLIVRLSFSGEPADLHFGYVLKFHLDPDKCVDNIEWQYNGRTRTHKHTYINTHTHISIYTYTSTQTHTQPP